MALSLYVHIPFCLRRCAYCDFVSGIYDPDKAAAYVDALKKEISRIPADKKFSTLYTGGGTPTALSTPVLEDLFRHIFSRFRFNERYEATVEANPGTLEKQKLQSIFSAGVNRISVGIQSFHDDELAFLGRVHSSREAGQAVRLARDAGFENIGIDLIYGIPGQNITDWMETLRKAVELRPKHISTYELTVEEGTLLYQFLSCPPLRVPGLPLKRSMKLPEGTIIELYNRTIDYLKSEGYIHYEISNFAMPDHFCRHNLHYWDRGEYYGAGLGAHSFIDGKRYCNTDNLDDYLRAVIENRSPVKETEPIAEDKALSEAIFLGLRKIEGIDLTSFSKRYKKDIRLLYQSEINNLCQAGLLEFANSRGSGCLDGSNGYLRLTRKGLLLSNEVFERFIV
jgi:oxygen-independent coproporphyrinogen-3 oxidase